MRYRSRPIEVEAIQWLGDVGLLSAFVKAEPGLVGICMASGGELLIETLEGTMECRCGSWLIRGMEGEYYPCKDSIFRAKYEPVQGS